MIVLVDYASPSVLESTRDATTVGLSTNLRRRVRFHGLVRQHGFILRIALRALGEAIWSNDTWIAQSDLLDPVITVHPDRIFFEAFSQDQSTYVSLIVDPAVFETMGEVVTGTTNIDFTAWLWGALGEMRTSRSTTFRIGPEGVEVRTSSAGGRFEKKVELPDTWVRGFLQVQAAMGMPGTRIAVKPIDLLSAVRFLRHSKAKVSPRGIRYEFEPGQDARLVLEPWEHVVPLEGAEHNYTEPKTTRVWGRRRLKLIEGLLPFAEGVDIYLKGRALPSFYAVKLPGMTFLLGLTGWSGSGFTGTGGFDLLAEARGRQRQPARPGARSAARAPARLHRRGGHGAEYRQGRSISRARAAVPAGPHHVRCRDAPLPPPRAVRDAGRRGDVLSARPAAGAGCRNDRREQGARRKLRRGGDQEGALLQGPELGRGQAEDRARDHLSRLAHHRCGRGPGSGRDRRQRHGSHHLRPLHVPAFRRAPDEPGAVRAHARAVQGERGAARRSPIELAGRQPNDRHDTQAAVTLGG